MSTRIKRTYNLPERTVKAVRELADQYVAPSQDAVVELAVEELVRRLRHVREEAAWARAAVDPLFTAEVTGIEDEFVVADVESWPPA